MKKLILISLLILPALAFSQSKPKQPVASSQKPAAIDSVKQDSLVVYTPTDFQMQIIQDYQKQIDELTKKEMEFILFGFGVAINPKTLQFDGKQFKAKKQ